MTKTLLICYDDSPDEVVDKVNEILKDRGLEFVFDEPTSQMDDGNVRYKLTTTD